MPPNPPNILLITTDQQRYDTIGEGAPGFLRTPHTGSLQNDGITFTTAYASWPNCTPSRCSIMTGTTQVERGIGNESIARETSLPSLLRDEGYQTAAIGKMHFDSQDISPRIRHGFGEMIPMLDYYREKERAQSTDRQPLRHGLSQTSKLPAKSTVPESETLTAWIVEEVVDYVRNRRDPTVPFFLWCSLPKPHPPWDPPEPYYSMYRDSPIPDPVDGAWEADGEVVGGTGGPSDPEILQASRAAYYGLVTQNDYNMGRIFGALDEAGVMENTMMLFTSDHGEYLGDHGAWAKGRFHEPAARLPFVLRLPESWDDRRAGTTCETPVQLGDILPTFVSAAGGDPSDVSDGQDLTALARGEWETPRQYAVGICHRFAGLTDGDWKYVVYPSGREQLFDLRNDPHETENLTGHSEFDEQRATLRTALTDLLSRHDSDLVTDGELSPWDPRAVLPDDDDDEDIQHSGPHHTEYYRDRDILH